MTKAEAIAMLKRIQEPEAWEPQINQAAFEALDMAIEALSQESSEDVISRQAAIDAILAIKDYGNSDRANALGLAECAVTTLPSAQSEQIARDIATIIENEQDMRVLLKNAEHTETHSCDSERTGTHDLVSRQAAIDSVCEVCENCEYFKNEKLVQTIKGLPSVQPQRWIQVSEAVPEPDERVAVTTGGYEYHVWDCMSNRGDDYFWEDEEGYYHNKYAVDAWMPLPEAYKGGQNET